MSIVRFCSLVKASAIGAVAVMLAVPTSASAQLSNGLWGVSVSSPIGGTQQLVRIDHTNGQIVQTVNLSFSGGIASMNGLAYDAGNNILYGVLRPVGGSAQSRRLVSIDPITGVCTDIGAMGDSFANITFHGGTLYGVTGEGGAAAVPESLFSISTVNGSSTFIMNLGNGNDGEAIAFNSDNGLLYHASGRLSISNAIWESVNLVGPVVSPIGRSGYSNGIEEISGLAYAGGGLFYATNIDFELISITNGGVVSFIGMDPSAGTIRGLVWVVPAPGAAALLGLAGVAAVRRRR